MSLICRSALESGTPLGPVFRVHAASFTSNPCHCAVAIGRSTQWVHGTAPLSLLRRLRGGPVCGASAGIAAAGQPLQNPKMDPVEEVRVAGAAMESEARAIFNTIDTNADGHLTAQELCTRLADFGLTDDQISILFYTLDYNVRRAGLPTAPAISRTPCNGRTMSRTMSRTAAAGVGLHVASE